MVGFFNHMNPAVIKNVMRKMSKDEFVEVAQFIKKQALELEPGNKRNMYVQLYGWCRSVYSGN